MRGWQEHSYLHQGCSRTPEHLGESPEMLSLPQPPVLRFTKQFKPIFTSFWKWGWARTQAFTREETEALRKTQAAEQE